MVLHDAQWEPRAGRGGAWDRFWLHRRRRGVQEPRPIFTGDVFEGVPTINGDQAADLVVVQHPCALQDRNNELRAALLAARLIEYEDVPPAGWKRNYDIMLVVVHSGPPPRHQAIAFDQLILVRSADLALAKRVACMEIEGVTLLRWANVNTRVVVPRSRFEAVIESQFAEADGM